MHNGGRARQWGDSDTGDKVRMERKVAKTCFKSPSVVSLERARYSTSLPVISQYFMANCLRSGPGGLQKKTKEEKSNKSKSN